MLSLPPTNLPIPHAEEAFEGLNAQMLRTHARTHSPTPHWDRNTRCEGRKPWQKAGTSHVAIPDTEQEERQVMSECSHNPASHLTWPSITQSKHPTEAIHPKSGHPTSPPIPHPDHPTWPPIHPTPKTRGTQAATMCSCSQPSPNRSRNYIKSLRWAPPRRPSGQLARRLCRSRAECGRPRPTAKPRAGLDSF